MHDTQTRQPNNVSTAQNPVGRFMVAAGAVIEHTATGKILLIRRAAELDFRPNEWEIVYGRLDQFEDLETGLRREVKEEVGITDLHVNKPLRHWHMFRGPKKADNELIGITFYCTTSQSQVHLSQEHSEYAWVTRAEAQQLVTNPGIAVDVTALTP